MTLVSTNHEVATDVEIGLEVRMTCLLVPKDRTVKHSEIQQNTLVSTTSLFLNTIKLVVG